MDSFLTTSTELSLLDQINAVDVQLRNEAGDYICGLQDAFTIQYYLAIARKSYGRSPSSYWCYDGPDALPFEIHSHCREGNFTIAQIQGYVEHPSNSRVADRDEHCRGNRMSAITEALNRVATSEGLSVEFESVGNEHLGKFLASRGYKSTFELGMYIPIGLPMHLLPSPSMIWSAGPMA